jgi:hypothetical protein
MVFDPVLEVVSSLLLLSSSVVVLLLLLSPLQPVQDFLQECVMYGAFLVHSPIDAQNAHS